MAQYLENEQLIATYIVNSQGQRTHKVLEQSQNEILRESTNRGKKRK